MIERPLIKTCGNLTLVQVPSTQPLDDWICWECAERRPHSELAWHDIDDNGNEKMWICDKCSDLLSTDDSKKTDICDLHLGWWMHGTNAIGRRCFDHVYGISTLGSILYHLGEEPDVIAEVDSGWRELHKAKLKKSTKRELALLGLIGPGLAPLPVVNMILRASGIRIPSKIAATQEKEVELRIEVINAILHVMEIPLDLQACVDQNTTDFCEVCKWTRTTHDS